MTRKQFRNYADRLYANDILTPLERRRKALTMSKSLSKEKIGEVQALIESGAKKADIIEQTGVSASSFDRIRSGQLTAEGKADKPEPAQMQTFTALETARELITPRELDTLRALIGQAVKAFAGIECATAADSYNLGQTFGLLSAAQLILEGGA